MWFEVALISTIFAVGNIVFGHFEERTPKWRRLLKFMVIMCVAIAVSRHLGREWLWAMLGAMSVVVLVIHAWLMPRKGINGWTGEPREKYYKLRGWAWPPE